MIYLETLFWHIIVMAKLIIWMLYFFSKDEILNT